jgi:NAD(P)-dependent dehydrogenase (short-subunit alcohol dehydrogenase family)
MPIEGSTVIEPGVLSLTSYRYVRLFLMPSKAFEFAMGGVSRKATSSRTPSRAQGQRSTLAQELIASRTEYAIIINFSGDGNRGRCMANELAGKVAIVTGGASGIGRGTVHLFVKEGCRVVIADINQDFAADALTPCPTATIFCRTDVSKSDQVESLVDLTVKRFGRLDIMFNNAGFLAKPGTTDLIADDFADFAHTMAVDLLGVMLGTRFAARAMSKTGGGTIINTASTTATVPGIGILSYRAAKAGVWNFTQNAAIALGKYGVRVNAISPGPIATDVLTQGLDLPAKKREAVKLAAFGALMQQRQPLKRLGTPEDVANAALFLASDRSAQVTGINLQVSGGEHVGDAIDTSRLVETAFLSSLSE